MREVSGIPIDPELPPGFDDTPNDERPDSHQEWWHRPYIVTDRFEIERYEQYVARVKALGYEPDFDQNRWDALQLAQAKSWQAAWPTGVRYTVRCLDGGAWDRSTNYGSFPTLDAALEAAGKLGNAPTLDDEEPAPGPY